jgi:endonuclease G
MAPAAPPVSASVHVALGIPFDADPSDDVLLDHGAFVVSYNPRLRVPNWVGWRLVEKDLGPVARGGRFHADPLLPAALPHVRPGDYLNSGFDRGHLCPSADRTSTERANDETFVMTNMTPQDHDLNTGPWKQLETYERGLAQSGHTLYIVAGVVFDRRPPTIGPGIAVPARDYKILVVLAPGQTVHSIDITTTVIAVEMPNDLRAKGHSWRDFGTSIAELEVESGYDFLGRVPAPVQRVLEGRSALGLQDGLEVDDRGAVDGLEGADPQRRALDGPDGHPVQTQGVGAVW